ncbi:hypothetical protein EKI60_04065 [Candidatus Saccharibacteria bacterium]|nr:MAG: hypothetical protein EKI60_04065 [Candidatus Saccharibacteria bacterium]
MNRLCPEVVSRPVAPRFKRRAAAVLLAVSMTAAGACGSDTQVAEAKSSTQSSTTDAPRKTEVKEVIGNDLDSLGDALSRRVVRVRSSAGKCTGLFVAIDDDKDVLLTASHCDTDQKTGRKTTFLKYTEQDGSVNSIGSTRWVTEPLEQDVLVAQFSGERSADMTWSMPEKPDATMPKKGAQFVAATWPTSSTQPIVSKFTFLGVDTTLTDEPKFVFYANPDNSDPNAEKACGIASSGSYLTNGTHSAVMSAAWSSSHPDWDIARQGVEEMLNTTLPEDVTQICYGAEVNIDEISVFADDLAA